MGHVSCLFFIRTFSLAIYLFKSLNELPSYLIVSLSFILNTVFFLGVYFTYVFSHLVACLLLFLAVSFEKQTGFWWILIYWFFITVQFILFNESLFNSLEKEMATPSSTLVWKISWMEEPGRLQPIESRRVGHDWATSLCFTYLAQDYWDLLLPPPSPYRPSGSSQCTSPSIQYRALNLDWQLVSSMIFYMFQCHSPKSSHPLPLPQSP